MYLRLIFVAVLTAMSFSGGPPPSAHAMSIHPEFDTPIASEKMAKNIILMIGDGMGAVQITAGLYMNDNQLQLERCTHTGFQKTHSSNKLTTDSAAGATAMACGQKSYNGAIAVDEEKNPMPTILEEAESKGLQTGLVATATIVHATPAAFVAHVESRKQYEDIATYFLETEVDYFVGGGFKYFSDRKDNRNLINEMKDKGYHIEHIQDKKLEDITLGSDRPFGYFTAATSPKSVRQGRDYLPLAAQLGANFLDSRSDNGFFMMVEGSQIDWGGHSQDSEYIIEEMLDFDETIGRILDFAEADGETLVIITADHETGGYSILESSSMGRLDTKFATDYHTPVIIPVFAFGPGAEYFSGIYENSAIYHKMRQAIGWE